MEPTGTPIRQRHGQADELFIIPDTSGRSDDTVVLRIQGAISAETNRALDHHLRTRLPPESTHIALDLSAATLLTAAGVRVLIEHARRLVATGRWLSLIAPSPHVMGILNVTGASNVIHVYDTVELAIVDARKSAAFSDSGASHAKPRSAADSGYNRILGLKKALQTTPVIAQATGLVQGRYDIDADRAAQLLGDSAQRHNLTVHHLAQALLATPAPGKGTHWFPGRRRRPEPFVTFYARPSGHRANHSAVVGSFFGTVLRYFGTTMGALHLTAPPGHAMWLDRRQGVPPRVSCHLVDPHHDLQPTVNALSGCRRVVVTDISTCTPIPADVRTVLIDSGIRSLHCTPLANAAAERFGTITAFHPDQGHRPTGIECAKADHAAAELAEWLVWHRDTIVLDALEDLHQRA